MGTPDLPESSSLASAQRRTALRGPQDLQEARLRDAVGRLQVLVLRDLVAQFVVHDRFGAALAYDCVYAIEIGLLLATVVTMIPLIRRDAAPIPERPSLMT